ncbi:MAG TPA: amino acid ABC transporter permease [Bacillota bacterium]|nr:amino acid ABC transporter permease [Bacillota bacterium]
MLTGIYDFLSTMITYIPRFLPGVLKTLQLSVFSILLGSVIGLFSTMLKLSNRKVLMGISSAYVSLIRGTPLLLLLIFIFYGLPSTGLMLDRFPSAVLGLAFHNGAYISEIFRGSIQSIDIGQREAALSLGMNKAQTMRRIILPQAFKRSVPSLGNQFIIAIKDSSLASTITITEIIMLTRQYSSANWNVFPIYTVAAGYYLVITLGLSKVLAHVEERLKVNER